MYVVYRMCTIRTKPQKTPYNPQKNRFWDCVDLCGFQKNDKKT